MKKELILARNIIKTPVLLEQTYKKLNIEDVEFYRHELVSNDPSHEIDMKAKARKERRAQAVSQNEKRSSILDGP